MDQSETRAHKKLTARACHGHFVGLESEQSLFRVYVRAKKKIIITRAPDFHICSNEKLFDVAALFDGIARQNQDEAEKDKEREAEHFLAQALQAFHIPL